MFCALYGATFNPRRANARHNPVVTTLFPASDVVPAIKIPLTKAKSTELSYQQTLRVKTSALLNNFACL
jgi:hypothetical protein